MLAFLVGVLTGGRRFAHAERLRSDEVIRGILGVKQMPSAMTVTRYFGAWYAATWNTCLRYCGTLQYGGCGRQRWAQCSIWIPPSLAITGISRAV